MASQSDRVIRAMTDDGAFRAIVASTTQTVRGVLKSQSISGSLRGTFADLLTASVLYRETMAPDLRVQAILVDGKARFVADSNPSGKTRGLKQAVANPPDQPHLQVMRTLPGGAIHQGVVQVPESRSVSDAFMAYMQSSEQITTMTSLGLSTDEEEIVAAGGYMLQLLPEAERGSLMVMTERLEDFKSVGGFLKPGFDAHTLLDELLFGIQFTVTGESDVGFGCWCSSVSLLSALATLARDDIEHLVKDGKMLEITCDYCRKEYNISPTELQGMLDSN